MACSKRGWELQQLQKLKEEEEERQIIEGDEDLFTYTREDAYNMVGGHRNLFESNKKWCVDCGTLLLTFTFSLHFNRSMYLMQRTAIQKSCR